MGRMTEFIDMVENGIGPPEDYRYLDVSNERLRMLVKLTRAQGKTRQRDFIKASQLLFPEILDD